MAASDKLKSAGIAGGWLTIFYLLLEVAKFLYGYFAGTGAPTP